MPSKLPSAGGKSHWNGVPRPRRRARANEFSVTEAIHMKLNGIISMGVLLLLLGAVATTYAQQEEAKPPKQDQQAKPEKKQQDKAAKQQQQAQGQQQQQQKQQQDRAAKQQQQAQGQQQQQRVQQQQQKQQQDRAAKQQQQAQGQQQQQRVQQQQQQKQQQDRAAKQQQQAQGQQQQQRVQQQQQQKQQQDRAAKQQQQALGQQQQQRVQQQQKQQQERVVKQQQQVQSQQQRAQQQQQQRVQQQQQAQGRPQASQQGQRVQQAEQRGVWQQHRATNWQSQHQTWQQRGGYSGYRIPEDRYRGNFGQDHSFRVYSAPVEVYGGRPRFQYGGYWFSVVDPWPEYWSDDWYQNDDVYIDYSGDGYYLYNRRYPGVGISLSVFGQQGGLQIVWQNYRARNWRSQHRTWRQRGGYRGYRIPGDRFRGYFGPDHWFRIYSIPVELYGGRPRFQYGGYWFSFVDPWPEYWSNDWYDNDDVYIDYSGDGYYLYNRRHPGDRVAIRVYVK